MHPGPARSRWAEIWFMKEKIFTQLNLQRQRQSLDILGRFSRQTRDGARGRCRGWKCPGRKNRPQRFAGPALGTVPVHTLPVCSRPEFLQFSSPCPKIAETRKKRGKRRKASSPHPPEPAEPAPGVRLWVGVVSRSPSAPLLSLRWDRHGQAANAF